LRANFPIGRLATGGARAKPNRRDNPMNLILIFDTGVRNTPDKVCLRVEDSAG